MNLHTHENHTHDEAHSGSHGEHSHEEDHNHEDHAHSHAEQNGASDDHSAHEHHEHDVPAESTDGAALADAHSHGGHVHESSGNFFQDYWDLLTDPAHFAVELTFLIFGELLLALLFIPLIKRYFNYRLDKAHRELDIEHGVDHDEATTESKP